MKIIMKRDNEIKELAGNKRVKDILKELDVNPESVLVIKDGETLTPDTIVKDDEEIEILSVVSGG
ncbi:MoaD/ThiS family protein [Natranaerofaba carboxydovora]|uniref:MoaD/ThiS family protein n=1 Tax=Natranaerofaba carboxydovora TaxID=2742683 RepID=UPI001F13A829|nr:MoaD/ThiS family protein [Natranaerofaba carboxydovora]UMZ73997.1 ThiS family protein [Natranaerofaba carboxydovora]